LKRLLARYEAGEFAGEGARAILRLVAEEKAPEVAAARALAAATKDEAVKAIANRLAAGKLDHDALASVLDYLTGEDREAAAMRLLARATRQKAVAKFLKQVAKKTFDDAAMAAKLDLVLSAKDLETMCLKLLGEGLDETAAIALAKRRTGDPALKRLLARYEAGEFAGEGARAILRLVAEEKAPEVAAARALATATEDEAVKAITNRLAAGKLNRTALAAALDYVVGDDREAAAMRLLARATRQKAVAKFLKQVAKKTFDDAAMAARLDLVLSANDLETMCLELLGERLDETAAVALARQRTADPALKQLLARYEAGEFAAVGARGVLQLAAENASPEMTAARVLATSAQNKAVRAIADLLAAGELDKRALAAVLGYVVGDDRERAAEKLLMRTTRKKTISKVLKLAGREDFDDQAMAARLDRVLSAENLEGFCVSHLKRHVKDKTVNAVLSRFEAGKLADDDRFRLVRHLMDEEHYAADLFGTLANATFLKEDWFTSAYAAGHALGGWGTDVRWRMYTLICCARAAAHNPGNFVECGVDRGGSAMCVIGALGKEAFAGRKFYLFDTFAGLVADQLDAEERKLTRITGQRYPESYAEVVRSFSPFPFVEVVRGAVPDTLKAYGGGGVAYLHIDMNVAYPERAAFEYFWPMLAKGAPVIFDDYGFPFHKRQKLALDEAARGLGVDILLLPTGQGLLWK
jgi:ABC-type xylose transport system substrate-binding protein